MGYHHLYLAIFSHTKNSQPYNLRLNSQFSRLLVRSVFNGTKSISYLGSVVWDILPHSYKILKTGLKKRKPENCPCRLSKTYISRVGSTQAYAPESWKKLWYFPNKLSLKKLVIF